VDLPSEDSLRWIVSRFARVQSAFGEFLEKPLLVRPNGEHFPDEVKVEPDGVMTIFRRVLSYTPVAEDVEIELAFIEREEGAGSAGGGGGCGSGACGTGKGSAGEAQRGTVVDLGNRYGVALAIGDVTEPTLLTTALARSAGSLLLYEGEAEVDPGDLGPLSEVAAVAAGLGVLVANGAALYKKACGGLRMHQGTHLSVEEAGVALALFVRMHDEKPGAVKRDLPTTQSEAFDEALRWVDSNPEIVASLKRSPELLVDGVFDIQETKSVLGRLMARRKSQSAELGPESAKPKRERTPEEERRLAEAKALVEEALRG
jgi:hypothetical protein